MASFVRVRLLEVTAPANLAVKFGHLPIVSRRAKSRTFASRVAGWGPGPEISKGLEFDSSEMIARRSLQIASVLVFRHIIPR